MMMCIANNFRLMAGEVWAYYTQQRRRSSENTIKCYSDAYDKLNNYLREK